MNDRAMSIDVEARELIEEGIEAFRLTREYVGNDTLPAIEGWSWFDWTEKAKEYLARLVPAEDAPAEDEGWNEHAPDCPLRDHPNDKTAPACTCGVPAEDEGRLRREGQS